MNANTPLHVHPLIGEVFELLHRMTLSTDSVLAWHAWDAIKKLQKYEEEVSSQTFERSTKGRQ
ncbi:MAG: hypothetical protein PW999_09845 [Paraburkholderia tropica]|nr:hypothetical protein [Paraburkholderia tropica]